MRINDRSSAFWAADVEALRGLRGLRGVMLAKVESAEVASRIGQLPGPLDGPTVRVSHALLRDQSAVGVSLGMTAELCLRPKQAGVVNECFSPSPSDVLWARDFLADFQRGSVVHDGSDLPRLGRARRIQEHARAFRLNLE